MCKKAILLALLATQLIAHAQTDSEPKSAIGWDLYRQGKYEEALTLFQNTLSINPSDPYALQGQAYALFQSKQYHLALLTLPKVVEWERTQPDQDSFHDPNTQTTGHDYNAQSLLAWSLYYIGKPKAASRYFYANLDRHPNWDNSLTGLGYTALHHEDKTLAQTSFRQALLHNPNNKQARLGLEKSKALDYGFNFSLFASVADDGHESPYERSSNSTLRASYAHFRNHVTLQARFNRLEERNQEERKSANKATLSWVHFVPLNAIKKWGIRFDLHSITHDLALYDHTTLPYVALMYFDQSHDQYYDLGYATAHFSEGNTLNQITLNQFSATAARSHHHRTFWSSIRLMGQHIHQDNDQAKNQSYWSATAQSTYHLLPKKLDITAYATLGERRYTYKPNLYSLYDRLDKQESTIGASIHYQIDHHTTAIADYRHDRYEHLETHFGVNWYSLGLSYAF